MMLDNCPTKYFGSMSEALVLLSLPKAQWSAYGKQSQWDILWKGIKIEVKGVNINKKKYFEQYTFVIGNNIYTSSKSKWFGKSKIIHPDVFVFCGWNSSEVKFWVVSKKKLLDKKCFHVHVEEGSEWIEYMTEDIKEIKRRIMEEYEN